MFNDEDYQALQQKYDKLVADSQWEMEFMKTGMEETQQEYISTMQKYEKEKSELLEEVKNLNAVYNAALEAIRVYKRENDELNAQIAEIKATMAGLKL